MSLSPDAIKEIEAMFARIVEMFDNSIKALETNDKEQAKLVLKIENQVNQLNLTLRQNYIRRLNEGKCKVLSGIVFLDTVSNFEKIGEVVTEFFRHPLESVLKTLLHDLVQLAHHIAQRLRCTAQILQLTREKRVSG